MFFHSARAARDLRAGTLTLVAAWTSGVATACDRPEPPAVETGALRLAFEFAGCERVDRDLSCELGPERTLTIWVAGNTPPQVLAGPTDLQPEASSLVADGHRAQYLVPSEARELTVKLGSSVGRLALKPGSTPEVLTQARELRRSGKWAEARALLTHHLSELPTSERMRAHALLARLALAEGNVGDAVQELERTAAAATRDGLTSEAAFDTLALAFTMTTKLHDFGQARALLEQATSDYDELPEVRALLPYYKGVLAVEMGEQQAALLHLKEAILRADRLNLRSDVHAAKKLLAATLHGLGRHREATALQEELMAESNATTPCIHLGNLITLTWFLLTSKTTPVESEKLTDIARRIDAALIACPDPTKRRNHELNLVHDALRRRNWDAAERHLGIASSLKRVEDTRLTIWEELFRGRLYANLHQWPEALSHFLRSETLALASGERALVHAAKLERADVLVARGKLRAAVALLREVEQLADELVSWVPFGEGQQLFALELEGGTRSLIDTLLRLRQPEQAAWVARRGRLRMVGAAWRASRMQALDGARRAAWEQAVADYRRQKAALEELANRDWELSKIELQAAIRQREVPLQTLRNTLGRAHAVLDPKGDVLASEVSPQPLERVSLLVSRGSERWYAFVGTGHRWQAFELGAVTQLQHPTQWARALAKTLDQIPGLGLPCAAQCTLGVILHPVLEGLDVHALTYRELTIVDHVPVLYVLDDLTRSPRHAPSPSISSTLIVGDPSGDLLVARQEAQEVAASVRGSRHTVLLQSDATKRRLLDSWNSADLFHFSGHAHFGGTDGLESYLLLAQGEQLTLAEVLTAGGSPRFAVLSACDAGRAREGSEGGLGMSHAFVAAGSEVVVAPSRTVTDGLAARFARKLYSNLRTYSVDDWARAAQLASSSLRMAESQSDWSTFRVHAVQ